MKYKSQKTVKSQNNPSTSRDNGNHSRKKSLHLSLTPRECLHHSPQSNAQRRISMMKMKLGNYHPYILPNTVICFKFYSHYKKHVF
ncbi:PHD finger protein 10 [Frankliniella fusca]|uniref:PHD finger protein 10 n=1 Tax=Frankliniella fusca TaxID=407009 RepID=A0AAE1HDG9_9NEOP|nr:PHD finger protein 10 [Frankliniella fusca]